MSGSSQMSKIQPLQKNELIPEQVYNYLLELIREGVFALGQKLPSENDLAKSLNVSRLSLREALQRLDLEGYIVRKRGIGTFILGAQPYSLEPGFERLHSLSGHIISRGRKPGTAEINVTIEQPHEDVRRQLRMSLDESAIVINRLRTIDNQFLSWSKDWLPSKYFDETPDPGEIGESLYKYLETRWGYSVAYAQAKITAVKSDAFLSEKLDITLSDPLIKIDQIHYLSDSTPIMYTSEWLLPHIFSIEVNRHR